MNALVLLLVLSFSYCFAEQLLGGWRVSHDEALKEECLNKALAKVHGTNVDDSVRSLVSDHVCATQVVNGLNIKCSFVLSGQQWQCSFYQSFINPSGAQLEECQPVKTADVQPDSAVVPAETEANQENPQKPLSDDDNEEDDDAIIDEINQGNA